MSDVGKDEVPAPPEEQLIGSNHAEQRKRREPAAPSIGSSSAPSPPARDEGRARRDDGKDERRREGRRRVEDRKADRRGERGGDQIPRSKNVEEQVFDEAVGRPDDEAGEK